MKQFFVIHLGGVVTIYVQRIRYVGSGKFVIKTNRYTSPGYAAIHQLMNYSDQHPLLAEFIELGAEGGQFIKISG